jgi:hypothetical protein
MSSETSTEIPVTRRSDAAFEPWQLFTLAGLMGATVVVFLSRGQTPAGIILLSLTIFTAAVVGVAAWRTLAPFTDAQRVRGPVVLGGRTRAALEREKTLVLRAIKELEFDRAMGKVSEPDFVEIAGRLRVRAGRLIRQLDATPEYREQIQREIEQRIGPAPAARAAPSCQGCGRSNDPDARFCVHCGRAFEETVRTCAGCGHRVDADARFCKHCGARQEASQ